MPSDCTKVSCAIVIVGTDIISDRFATGFSRRKAQEGIGSGREDADDACFQVILTVLSYVFPVMRQQRNSWVVRRDAL
jgi:hypothetical protein